MAQRFQIHPQNPQKRLLRQVADSIRQGAVIVYPTDSAYALGCRIDDLKAQERIRQIRQLDKHHHFTLICGDLSHLATYAHVDSSIFRLLKAYTPGPYTFILEAASGGLQYHQRKTIGLRVPKNATTLTLLEELNEPLMSVTLVMPEETEPLADPDTIYERLKDKVDIFVDSGAGSLVPTTIVDLTGGEPRIVRKGQGDPTPFIHLLK